MEKNQQATKDNFDVSELQAKLEAQKKEGGGLSFNQKRKMHYKNEFRSMQNEDGI